MEPPVVAAIIGASGAAVGWLANHGLTARREEARRRVEAQLKFVERQIEELYGPLAAALYEGRRTFLNLLDSLGRKKVFDGEKPLPEEELKTWLFWAESDFLPRNTHIKELLRTKAHLVDDSSFPDSYVLFFDHCNSWAINHKRWKEQGVAYSWRSKINWPDDFESEVLHTFRSLKARQSQLIGKLKAGSFSK